MIHVALTIALAILICVGLVFVGAWLIAGVMWIWIGFLAICQWIEKKTGW